MGGGPRKYIIRDTERELLKVATDGHGRGKVLIFISPNRVTGFDVFHVGISWDSLRLLEEQSVYDIFHWEVADSSLTIRGKFHQWDLTLSNQKTGASFEILLTEEETELLKNVLFEDLSEEAG